MAIGCLMATALQFSAESYRDSITRQETAVENDFFIFLCQPEALLQLRVRMDEFDPDQKTNLEAFSLLVEEHQGAVRSFVTARIDDAFEAEDIAQEAFLIAFRKLSEVDQSRPIRPWLCAIAGNLVKNYRRKRRAKPVGGSGDVILDLLHPLKPGRTLFPVKRSKNSELPARVLFHQDSFVPICFANRRKGAPDPLQSRCKAVAKPCRPPSLSPSWTNRVRRPGTTYLFGFVAGVASIGNRSCGA